MESHDMGYIQMYLGTLPWRKSFPPVLTEQDSSSLREALCRGYKGAIYWAEGSESVSKCDSGRQMVYCGREHVGEFEELKYLERVSGKHRYVTHKNSDINK